MISPINFLYGLFVIAVLMLLINVRFKVPKKFFVFIVVLILTTTCWVAMDFRKTTTRQGISFRDSLSEIDAGIMSQPPIPRRIESKIISENISLERGENKLPVSFEGVSERCKGVTYLLNFVLGQGENLENFSDCLLTIHISDTEYLECSAVSFSNNEIRYVFVFPQTFDFMKISFLRLVCNSGAVLNLKTISEERIFD